MVMVETGEGEWLIAGSISIACGDSNHILIGDWRETEPLAELAEQFNNCQVSVRYWISDEEITKEQAIEATVMMALGCTESKFRVHHSEVTGYLWTDEDFNVGGHDLIEEVSSFDGKYLLMEVLVHNGVSELEYYPWLSE